MGMGRWRGRDQGYQKTISKQKRTLITMGHDILWSLTMSINNGKCALTKVGDLSNQFIYIDVAINVLMLYTGDRLGTVFLVTA